MTVSSMAIFTGVVLHVVPSARLMVCACCSAAAGLAVDETCHCCTPLSL